MFSPSQFKFSLAGKMEFCLGFFDGVLNGRKNLYNLIL